MYTYIYIYCIERGINDHSVFLRQCSFLLRVYYAQLTRVHVKFSDVISLSSYAPALAEVTVLLPPSMQKYKNNEKQMENNENN